MPQLIPHPWFAILVVSWLILLLLAPKKILSHTTLNDPDSKTTKVFFSSWTWPW